MGLSASSVPLIGAHSITDSLTPTSSPSADASYPLSRLSDDRTFYVCKNGSATNTWTITWDAGAGNTIKADYLAIMGHDLFDPASDGNGAVQYKLEKGDNALSYSDVFSYQTPTNNKIICKTFTQEDTRAYRLSFYRASNTFIASIGEIQLGEGTYLPYGIEFAGYQPKKRSIRGSTSFSVAGRLLGSTYHKTERMNTPVGKLFPATWWTGTNNDDFGSILEQHVLVLKPFVWSWNPDNSTYEQDAYWCMLDPNTTPDETLATQLSSGFRDWSISLIGEDELSS